MKLRSISTEPFGIAGSSFNEASSIAVLTSRPVVRNPRKLREYLKIFKSDAVIYSRISRRRIFLRNFIDPNVNERVFIYHLFRRDCYNFLGLLIHWMQSVNLNANDKSFYSFANLSLLRSKLVDALNR